MSPQALVCVWMRQAVTQASESSTGGELTPANTTPWTRLQTTSSSLSGSCEHQGIQKAWSSLLSCRDTSASKQKYWWPSITGRPHFQDVIIWHHHHHHHHLRVVLSLLSFFFYGGTPPRIASTDVCLGPTLSRWFPGADWGHLSILFSVFLVVLTICVEPRLLLW